MWHEIMLTLVGLGAISSGFQETLSDRQGNIPSTQHTMLSLTRAITIVVGFFFSSMFRSYKISLLNTLWLQTVIFVLSWVFLTAMNSSNVFFHVSFDKKVSMHWKLPNTLFMRLKQFLQLFCFSVIDCTKFHVTREYCKRPSSRERLDLFLNYME